MSKITANPKETIEHVRAIQAFAGFLMKNQMSADDVLRTFNILLEEVLVQFKIVVQEELLESQRQTTDGPRSGPQHEGEVMSYRAIRFRGIIFAAQDWHADAMELARKHFQLDSDEFEAELNRDLKWHGYYYPDANNWHGTKGFRPSDAEEITNYAIVVFETDLEPETVE